MADIQRRGGDEERQLFYAKMAGSAAAFGLLVMWMTPPTTPHPVAPSPLLAYKNVRSDAPTRDATVGMMAPSDYHAAAIPWWSLRAPQPARISYAPVPAPSPDPAPETSEDGMEGAPEDMPPAVPETGQSAPAIHQEVALARVIADPQPYQPRRETWAETVSTRSYDDGEAQEAAAEAGD